MNEINRKFSPDQHLTMEAANSHIVATRYENGRQRAVWKNHKRDFIHAKKIYQLCDSF